MYAALLPATGPAATAAQAPLDEIVVTATRRAQPAVSHIGNVHRLDGETLDARAHHHIHEIAVQIPGVWLSRGSGQEHLTAIRSPVLTGAGSCGAFLMLEDGIPVRPAGFCNVNQLFELNTEQARAIEVLRGPGSALQGSGALHGVINVLTPDPASDDRRRLSFETGAEEYYRGSAAWSGGERTAWSLRSNLARDGGFRADSGFVQAKLNLGFARDLGESSLRGLISASHLEQETAGFIEGFEAYEDPRLKRSNPNPEAFRDARSQRAYLRWERDLGRSASLRVTPYLRRSEMEFLQHFLPGQPLEENGHVSAGAQAAVALDGERGQLIAGLDLEWSDIELTETQSAPVDSPSAFLRETRPVGRHYDYAVEALNAAAYLRYERSAGGPFSWQAGLRLDRLDYDYDNRMLAGNTRDDGTLCGFGGCLFSRPADRSDDFTNLAPKLGASYRLSEALLAYAQLARGFRAPQATELYRLQNGQTAAELDSERLDSVELGLRGAWRGLYLDTAAYYLHKRDSVLRDAEGFNVTGGRSRHRGVELSAAWQALERLRIELTASYARQTYDFDRVAFRGETFVSGNDVDTAPRTLGALTAAWQPVAGTTFDFELVHQGSYYLEAENLREYAGHRLINLRAHQRLGARYTLSLRLNNLSDVDYADRADFAFGDYRYFPGRGRELFVEIAWQAGGRR